MTDTGDAAQKIARLRERMARLSSASLRISFLATAACLAQVAARCRDHCNSAGAVILESFRSAWDGGNGWTVALDPELAASAGPTGGDDPNPPSLRVHGLGALPIELAR